MASLEELKQKYQSVIDAAKTQGVSLKNVHIENGKLLIRGDAPNQAIKNAVWDQIKRVDPKYPDLTADINIDTSLPVPASRVRIHEVAAGDTLSKLAQKYYGEGSKYMKIFEANKDQLTDPNVIKVGQKLKIPN